MPHSFYVALFRGRALGEHHERNSIRPALPALLGNERCQPRYGRECRERAWIPACTRCSPEWVSTRTPSGTDRGQQQQSSPPHPIRRVGATWAGCSAGANQYEEHVRPSRESAIAPDAAATGCRTLDPEFQELDVIARSAPEDDRIDKGNVSYLRGIR